MTYETKGMIAASFAYIIFGLSYLFSSMALDIADPALLLTARLTVTVNALNILVLTGVIRLNLRGKRLIEPILVGLIQPVLYFFLENHGLKYTSTAFTGMVSSVSPACTALLGALMLREKPTAKQWLFIALTVSGVALVSLGGSGGENTWLGCVCLLGAYATGSFYSIFVRRLSKTYTPQELTYVMFTVGFVCFLGFSLIQRGAALPGALIAAFAQPRFTAAALYLGVGSSVVAYMLANYSLAALPVARSTIFTALSTIVSVLSGVIIRGDAFSWLSALAFALMLAGLVGVNMAAGQSRREEAT